MVNNVKIVANSDPANYTGAANTPEYVSLKDYNHVTFIIHCGAWAGGTAAVTVNEATAVAGTSAQALAFTKQWTNVTDTSTDTLVETTVTSNTFNLSAAGAIHVIELDAEALSDGFDCVGVAVATPGSNNDYYSIDVILSDPRYGSYPSAITN